MYYPFLSLIIQDIKFANEHLSYNQRVLAGSILLKIVTYNYLAGIWEPLIEKTLTQIEIITDHSEQRLSRQISVNVLEYKPKQGMNINISDLTVLYSI